MVAYVAAMAAVRQYLGDDLGEACSPDSEISCKFGMTCVDEVCAPYCESDEDCPGDIQCQSLEDTETPSDDADWVCDMPTELEQKLQEQLDRDVRPLIRPLAEGASRP